MLLTLHLTKTQCKEVWRKWNITASNKTSIDLPDENSQLLGNTYETPPDLGRLASCHPL